MNLLHEEVSYFYFHQYRNIIRKNCKEATCRLISKKVQTKSWRDSSRFVYDFLLLDEYNRSCIKKMSLLSQDL